MKKIKPAEPELPKLSEGFFDVEEEALFEEKTFSAQDVSYQTADNIALRNCQLDHVIFHKTKFDRLEVSNCIFDHCDFSNADWFGGSFHRVIFKNCKMTGTNFAEGYFRDCQFIDCLGDFCSFSSTNLKVVTFENCQLPQSEFFEITWQHLKLAENNLDDSNWFRTKLNGLDFTSNHFSKIALSQELLKGLKVNQEQALVIAAGMGLQIEE